MLTTDQVLVVWLDSRLKSGYYSREEGGSICAKAKFWCKLTPGMLLTFIWVYYLHDHLLESP